MVPGGVTDAIAHFAGYLHLIQDMALSRILYEDPARPHRVGEDDDRHPGDQRPGELPELPSLPIRVMLSPEQADAPAKTPLTPSVPPPISGSGPVFDPHAPIALPPRSGGGGGGGGGRRSAEGDDAPEPPLVQEAVIDIDQINTLIDSDVVYFGPQNTAASLNHADPGSVFELFAQARSKTPADLRLPVETSEAAMAFVSARDTATAESGAAGPSILPGSYVDGVRVEDAPDSQAALLQRSPTSEPPRLGHEEPGLSSSTGSNILGNEVRILDLNVQHSALIVGGDVFETDAVVQRNVLHDHDLIEILGGEILGGAGGTPAVGANRASNTASVIETELPTITGTRGGATEWSVTYIDDDFLDIRSISQTNWIRDDDITAQTVTSSHDRIVVGSNTQLNLSAVMELSGRFDLIIVEGDYHRSNLIYQTNVLLDDDVASVTVDGGSAGYALTSGGNTLFNEATILHYGDHTFTPLPGDLSDYATSLENTPFGSDLAGLIPGGGDHPISVLYIRGDFWDINAVFQTNLLADPDTAVQHLDSGTDAEPTGTITTGGNMLGNLATIIDLGTVTEAQFLAGQHYTQTLLIQANLVSEAADIRENDPRALVNEVIAFIDHDEGDADASTGTTLQTGDPLHHDMLGSMLV